jgi:GTP-binding protein LepA
LLNGETVDALVSISHKSNAEQKGREMAKKLKDVLDRQQFEVQIQVLANNRPVARET